MLPSHRIVVSTPNRVAAMINVELVKALPSIAWVMVLGLINGPVLATEHSCHGLPCVTPFAFDDCTEAGHSVALASSISPAPSIVVLRA